MIFTENQPPKADQGIVSRTEDTPLHPETQGPPPAYSAAGANQNTPMIMNYSFHPPPRESAERRFWKAFFVAVLVWILAGALLRSVVDLANAGRHRHWVGIALDSPSGGIAKDWPEFSSGEVKSCIDRKDWPLESAQGSEMDKTLQTNSAELLPSQATFSFDLPVDSDALYFLSRGSLASGSVKVGVGIEGGDKVAVDVVVSYWSSSALERTTVCELQRTDGQHGIGIFTPRNWHGGSILDRLNFDVSIRIPKSMSSDPRIIKNFETDFSQFRHEFGDLQDEVFFRSLDVKTSNSLVSSDAISVERASIKSSNGQIMGSYNTSSYLKLQTSNARIAVDVAMNNEDLTKPTELILKTSNGAIESNINLKRPGHPKYSKNSAFAVVSTTSNAQHALHFGSQPLGSQLTLDAKSSNGRTTAAVHPAYEGSFSLRTSNAQPGVEDTHSEDPSGEGRKRQTKTRRFSSGRLEGSTWWGSEEEKNKSWIHLQSSNSPVILVV